MNNFTDNAGLKMAKLNLIGMTNIMANQIDEKNKELAQLQLDNARMQLVIDKVANELKAYQPKADEYAGVHVHKGWAKQLESLATQPAEYNPLNEGE